MPIGPFIHYQVPGVYGPTSSEITKTDKGYAIGWAPLGSWGEPAIEGTPREIARDIIVRYSSVLALPRSTHGLHIDLDHIPYYGAIHIKWKPVLNVTLHDKLHTESIDTKLFVEELTNELKLLVKLLPFA